MIYDPEQPSYNSEAQKIVSGNPDGWVIIDFPETYAKVGPALVRTGDWDPKKSFITDGLASSELPKDVGRDATEGMRGTAPGSPDSGAAAEAFNKAYAAAPGPERQTFDAQNFDAVILCYLAAVAAGSTDGKEMAAELQNVSGPGGDKFTFEQLPEAIEALQNGDDIDYEGASGPLDLNEEGDPTSGVYDIYRYKDGKHRRLRRVAGRGAASLTTRSRAKFGTAGATRPGRFSSPAFRPARPVACAPCRRGTARQPSRRRGARSPLPWNAFLPTSST